MEMNRETLVQALHSTTVPDGQKHAGDFLDQCSKLNGFCPELLKIACDESAAPTIRQAAVIYFKNTIVKYWEVDDEEEARDTFKISDEDRAVLKANILEAVCIATDSTRAQLCVAAQQMIRTEFPEKWPELIPGIQQKLQTPDGSALQGALLIIYRMSKIYEYKRAKERQPLVEVIRLILPVMQQHFAQLAPNAAQESVTIQKLMFKIFYSLVQFSLNLEMINKESMDVWIQFSIDVLKRPVPEEVNQIEDLDERAMMVWWKCKKWAAKILDRVFERYGAPGQVESSYADFANHFLQNFSIPCVEVMMAVLNDKRQNMFVSHRVLHLALSFLTTSVSHSHTWMVLKPHANEIITTVLFPLLCHSEEDEEMWEDDVEEYVRFKYDIYEDMHNPSYASGSFLAALAKRKDVVHPALAFTIHTLASSKNPQEIDGCLRMIGELSMQLIKSKKYKKDVEKLLDAHVINRLSDASRFVRARAAWTIKQYSGASFSSNKILKKVIESLVKTLCNQNEELPAAVECALAIQALLDDQEKAQDLVRPSVSLIVPRVLELVAKSQIEDIVGVMDELMDQYMDEIIPIAANVAEQLATMFLSMMASEAAEERTPALMSIISTLSNILDVVSDHREIMVKIEVSVLRIIDFVFTTANLDFYDEVLLLMQSLLYVYVSEPMWNVFDMLYQLVKTDNGNIMMFSDVVPVLHLYVVTDTESFLARPERLNAIIDMCKSVLENNEYGDENQLYAAKMLEILILQCNGMINEAIPAIVVIALERMTKPFEEGLTELKHMLLLVIVAALYTNTELALRVLKELAPNHPNPLDYITQQLAEHSEKFEGVHNRKMAAFAWCTLLQLPPDFRPSIIAYEPAKVLKCCLSIFTGLQRALKAQAENRKLDMDSDSDEDEEEDDHRKIDEDLSDNDDEIDDTTLDYLDSLAKENKRATGLDDSDSDDEEDSMFEEETDTEQFTTIVDGENGPDAFVFFKQAVEKFKVCESVLFSQMIANLTPEEQNRLQELDQQCDNHVKSEQSKKLKEAGGYSFAAEAEVPGNFNFGA